jgi:organic radical activating enzyme
MKQPIKILQTSPAVSIYWLLTDFCNFKCNYCPEDLHSGKYATGVTPGVVTDDQIKKFVSRLNSDEFADKRLNIRLGGGEPTLHPMFPYIVKELRSPTTYVGVTTNGSRGIDWWKEILPLDHITISLHPEFTKIDKINELAEVILASGTSLMFNLSCDPNNWSAVQDLYSKLDDSLKKFVAPVMLNTFGLVRSFFPYTDEQLAWIRSLTNTAAVPESELAPGSKKFTDSIIYFDDGSKESFSLANTTVNGWNRFKGWNCSVGSQGLMIRFDGNVMAGLCKSTRLGTIDDFQLGKDIECPFEYCACPLDIKANKIKK